MNTDPTPVFTQDDMDVADAAIREWRSRLEDTQRLLRAAVAAAGGRIDLPGGALVDPPDIEIWRDETTLAVQIVSAQVASR